jgi:hypothetical protein
MTDVNRHGRETISAKGQYPPLRAALPDLEQRHITNYTNAMTQIISIMPNPGGGTRIAGDTRQEVLFFVTDGVEDETVNGSRVHSLMDPSYCTTIKNRGIRIAVLYTTYLPLPIGHS